MEIKLEVYTFKIRQKNNTNEYFELNDVAHNIDLNEFFKSFIDKCKTFKVSNEEKKSFNILSDIYKEDGLDKIFSGLIESGEYGDETKILTLKGTLKAKKLKNELAVRPFYFLINIPENGKKGYIILQRTGQFGITSIFKKYIREHFRTVHTDYVIDLSQYLSKELLLELLAKDGIQEIILTKYKIPRDLSDKAFPTFKEEIKKIQLKLTASSFFKIGNQVKKFINDPNAKIFDSASLREIGFEGKYKTSVVIKENGKPRTIDLSDTLEVKPYYNVTEEISIDESTGHPKFKSIDNVAKEYLKNIKK